MDPFSNRVAVITGGAGGIGRALADAFAARGAKLVLADVDESALAKTAKDLEAQGHSVLAVPTDVTQIGSVKQLAELTFQHFGAAHIVCNNAGVAAFGEMAQTSHEEWKFVMGVNFWGVVHGVEAFLPRLLEQGEGHLVNTASMAGLVGMQWLGVYATSKFAVVGLSESLHRELRDRNIAVSVLCPMIVDTQINQNSTRLREQRVGPAEFSLPDPPQGSMKGGVVSAESVAERVVRGIERKDLYILTHPEQVEILRRRHRRIEDSFSS